MEQSLSPTHKKHKPNTPSSNTGSDYLSLLEAKVASIAPESKGPEFAPIRAQLREYRMQEEHWVKQLSETRRILTNILKYVHILSLWGRKDSDSWPDC
jgi:hypothetical protein